MNTVDITHNLGIVATFCIYIFILIAGVYNSILHKYNNELVIIGWISYIATLFKLYSNYKGKYNYKEQLLMFVMFTIQGLGLFFNNYAFRVDYYRYVLITIISIIIIYVICIILFIPNFLVFFKNHKNILKQVNNIKIRTYHLH